jgi:protein-S-isoprenylcysteine O-methyltransferase Ste14
MRARKCWRKMPEQGFLRFVYRWRVRVSLIFVIVAIVLADPSPGSLLAGIGLTLAGLAIRAWACGHLEKEKTLAISGPYRFTRNPLYLGNLLIGIGVVVGARSWWVLGCALVLFALFYPVAVFSEKQKMEKLFPGEYTAYSQKVPLFFPKLQSSLPPRGSGFQRDLYKKNQEFRAILGSAIFWFILTAKLIFF